MSRHNWQRSKLLDVRSHLCTCATRNVPFAVIIKTVKPGSGETGLSARHVKDEEDGNYVKIVGIDNRERLQSFFQL